MNIIRNMSKKISDEQLFCTNLYMFLLHVVHKDTMQCCGLYELSVLIQ